MPSAPDAIPLCGGAGTRLRNIIGRAPKSLASIGGRPFIHLLLRRHGFQPVILAVGYHRELIRSHMGDQAYGLAIEYSIESTPLAPWGALRNVVDFITSDSVLL
jgi:NDP-sugar pyrophosphorylase family protein